MCRIVTSHGARLFTCPPLVRCPCLFTRQPTLMTRLCDCRTIRFDTPSWLLNRFQVERERFEQLAKQGTEDNAVRPRLLALFTVGARVVAVIPSIVHHGQSAGSKNYWVICDATSSSDSLVVVGSMVTLIGWPIFQTLFHLFHHYWTGLR